MNQLINSDFIFEKLEASSFEELIRKMSVPLLNNGDVTEEYPQKVISREAVFPTGLPTEPIGVAIPHTDPEYVNHNRIVIATLKNPILFKEMGASDDSKIEVSVVFLLALGQSNKQLNILQKIMTLFRDGDLLETIYNADKNEIEKIAKEKIE